jgi:hypothetical protein
MNLIYFLCLFLVVNSSEFVFTKYMPDSSCDPRKPHVGKAVSKKIKKVS